MEGRKTRSQLGRTLQDHRGRKTRSLPPRNFNRRSGAASLELKAPPTLPQLKAPRADERPTVTFTCLKKKALPRVNALSTTFTRKTKNYEWLDPLQRRYVGSLNGSSCNKKKHTSPRSRVIHAMPTWVRPGISRQTYRHSHPTTEYVLIRHILAGIRSYHSINWYVRNDDSYPFHNLLKNYFEIELGTVVI